MACHRPTIRPFALVAAVALANGCGDVATEPPPLNPSRPTTVSISPATAQMAALGETVQLAAQVFDQNGQVMAGAAVAWSTSSAQVATVSTSGLVTAAGNGAATITATAGAASGAASVTVAQEMSAVELTPDTVLFLASGQEYGDFEPASIDLSALVTDRLGHAIGGVSPTFRVVGDIATVNEEGLVTPHATGRGFVVAEVADAEISDSSLVVVNRAPRAVRRLDAVWVREVGGSERWDANGTFEDPDGDPMTFYAYPSSNHSSAYLRAEVEDPSVPVVTVTSIAGEVHWWLPDDRPGYYHATEVLLQVRDSWGHVETAMAYVTVGCPLLDLSGESGFDIEIRIESRPSWDSECTRKAIAAAEQFWEHALAGSESLYRGSGPHLTVTVEEFQGPEHILGTGAGNGLKRPGGTLPDAGGITLSKEALFERTNVRTGPGIEDGYDLEIPSPQFFMDVARHEIGHVLGFGSPAWHELLGDRTAEPNAESDVHFTGETAVAAFDSVGGESYPWNKVPAQNCKPPPDGGITLGCPAGRAFDGPHWREGALHGELMKPSATPRSSVASRVTLAALKDLGWIVNMDAAEDFRVSDFWSSAAAEQSVRWVNRIW